MRATLRLTIALLGAFHPFLLWGLVRASGAQPVPALQLVPAALSLWVCARFARSLRPGRVPEIERFARAWERDEIPAPILGWLRQATAAWCAFLAANTVLSAALALAAPVSWWAVWTGALVYVAMGALIAAEYAVRKVRFRWYGDGVADRLWARAFPPRDGDRAR